MPSPISINVECEPFHIRLMEHVYGSQPLILPRKDNFSLLLNYLLEKAPVDYKLQNFGERNLSFQLPYFDDKNVLYNFYLTPRKERILVAKIDEMFRITFRSEVNKSLLVGVNKIDSVCLFMEKYNLSEDCFDMLMKDYHRYRKNFNRKNIRLRKKNTSVEYTVCPA